jgi:gamma-glutamylcysteine synthetase
MYKIKKKGKNNQEHLIEKKYEHTVTFTLTDIEAHEYRLEKALKELTAQLEIENAKFENIKSHNKWLLTMAPEKMHAAHMCYEVVGRINLIGPKLKEIKKQIKEYKVEKEAIKQELGLEDESN